MRIHLLQVVHDTLGSFSKRGVVATLSLLPPEVLFDLRFGTDPLAIVPDEELMDVTSPNQVIGILSQGTNPKLFMDTFPGIRWKHCRGFSQETFVDFGCGKDRALLMAALCGFSKAMGGRL